MESLSVSLYICPGAGLLAPPPCHCPNPPQFGPDGGAVVEGAADAAEGDANEIQTCSFGEKRTNSIDARSTKCKHAVFCAGFVGVGIYLLAGESTRTEGMIAVAVAADGDAATAAAAAAAEVVAAAADPWDR